MVLLQLVLNVSTLFLLVLFVLVSIVTLPVLSLHVQVADFIQEAMLREIKEKKRIVFIVYF